MTVPIPAVPSIPALVDACGGTVHEARLRMRRGAAAEVRAVVAFPTVAGASTFRSAVTGFGARLEGNPTGLFGGRPLPPGFVVSFAVGADRADGLTPFTTNG